MGNELVSAIVSWIGYFLVFLFFGGLGAGLSAEGYELVTGSEFSSILYGVVFGVGGWMAFRLIREGRSSSAAS